MGGAVQPVLQEAILAWYATRARSLPFRGTTDPYAILVSEAMAQQTQVCCRSYRSVVASGGDLDFHASS